MLDKTIDIVNDTLGNRHINIFLMLISGIFLGYTLQPIPKWLNKQFNTNYLLKYIIICTVGLTSLHPITRENFISVMIISFAILIMFDLMRKFD